MLTVVIPFAERKFDAQCIWRLNNAIRSFKDAPVQVLVYDTSPTPVIIDSNPFSEQENVRYLSNPSDDLFSPGKVRNLAVQEVKTEYLLFFDADHVASPQFPDLLIHKLAELQQVGSHAFCMFPFLYLTKNETKQFSGDFSGCLESYLLGQNHRVEAIALSTCCLLLNRQHFLDVGGFDDAYQGHGCEDFDLVHKLTSLYPMYHRNDDYYLDDKQRFPACYTGFRRYFSYYSLEYLFSGAFVLHQWHPRPPIAYHKQRQGNEVLLQKNMRAFDQQQVETNESLKDCPDLTQFIHAVMNNYGFNQQEYSGLFHWKEGVKEQGKLQRKLFKLLRNPAEFLKDSRLIRLLFPK